MRPGATLAGSGLTSSNSENRLFTFTVPLRCARGKAPAAPWKPRLKRVLNCPALWARGIVRGFHAGLRAGRWMAGMHRGADRRVEIEQREEPPVRQPRQDPAPDHLDADLDFRLVARLVGPRRDDDG